MPELKVQGNKTIPKKMQSHAERLVSDAIAPLFFSLYNEGKSMRYIAKRCCVPVEALRWAYPKVNFSERGKIPPPFINKNPGKWKREQTAKEERRFRE